MERESMEFDVVVVGGGPAGLSAAIRLKQLASEKDNDISVCVIEKGSEIGAHILSGAVIEPRALDELIADWKDKGAPVETKVTGEKVLFLTKKGSVPLPPPPAMNNHGNYIVSLGNLCRWLAEQAEEMEIEVFAGFAGAEILYDENGRVRGVATGDMGLNKDGEPGPNHEPGVELISRQLVLAEGCRGSLTRELMEKFALNKDCDPQCYGIGVKEVWELADDKFNKGMAVHTMGYPMDMKTYGGGFIYHMDNNLVSVGFVIGLDYENPHLNPFEEFQKFKLHPAIKPIFEGARRVEYGARALSEGGYQSIPKLTFPGGVLVGDTAGFMNVPKIKGVHNAMKSGMVAAEAVFDALAENEKPEEKDVDYTARMEKSWVYKELYAMRNVRPAFHFGFLFGLGWSGLDTFILRGHVPFTMHYKPDHASLKKAENANKPVYEKADGEISFDRLSSVYVSNTAHEEDQPCHLTLKEPDVAINYNLEFYDAPEQRYCPAQVYEIVEDADSGQPKLQINFTNCVHCKTCDINDPTQNIVWKVPEGGGGPNYSQM